VQQGDAGGSRFSGGGYNKFGINGPYGQRPPSSPIIFPRPRPQPSFGTNKCPAHYIFSNGFCKPAYLHPLPVFSIQNIANCHFFYKTNSILSRRTSKQQKHRRYRSQGRSLAVVMLLVVESPMHLSGVHSVQSASSSTNAQANAEYLFNKREGSRFISSRSFDLQYMK
jgi:hypothetical protein